MSLGFHIFRKIKTVLETVWRYFPFLIWQSLFAIPIKVNIPEKKRWGYAFCQVLVWNLWPHKKGSLKKAVKMSATDPHVPNSPRCKAIHNCLQPSLFSPECNYFKHQNPGLFYSNPETHHFYSNRHIPRPCFKHPAPQPSPLLGYATGQHLNFRKI